MGPLPLRRLVLSASKATCVCTSLTPSSSLHPGHLGDIFSPYMEYGWRADVQRVLNIGEQTTPPQPHLRSPASPSPARPSALHSLCPTAHPFPSPLPTLFSSLSLNSWPGTCIDVFSAYQRNTFLGQGKGGRDRDFVCLLSAEAVS